MKITHLSKTFGIALAIIFMNLASQAQEGQGKVYFLRSTNYVASLVPFKALIDSQVVCKLKNNRYSVHAVTAGEHNFQTKATGLGSKKTSRSLRINIQSGKTTYLSVANTNPPYLEELTEDSGQRLLKRLGETRDCLKGK